MFLLCKSAHIMAGPLCKLINTSIETAVFPDLWKEACVLPLHKSGPSTDLDNYRPISILCCISKIIERHVHDSLFNHLKKFDLITPFQSGFMEQNSCETGLTFVIDNWYSELDKGNLIGVVNIDLRKAYNLLNHDILLTKLKYYGCSQDSINWFGSYLKNRKQHVSINGVQSDSEYCNYGIPQGSILGPLLFLIHVNDLPYHLSKLSIHMYADDTTVYFCSKEISDLIPTINDDLAKVAEWCINNKLVINTKKTKSMILCNHQKRRHILNTPTFCINGSSIINVEYDKILGVCIDQNMLMNKHIDQVCAKISRLLGLLWRVRKYLTYNTKILFYNSYIQPCFDYCMTTWGFCSDTHINRLYRLQKKIARIILDDNECSTLLLLQKLNWLSVKERIQYCTAVLVYKCLNKMAQANLSDLFQFCGENHIVYQPGPGFWAIGTILGGKFLQ